jgi:L-2-hydroxyglutarate oxidase LhgO
VAQLDRPHAGQTGRAFVFVGRGGWALKLLQRSGIPEIKGYGVFPIGGQFLKTTNPALVAQHKAKVYSQASVGRPPMSVPHLDTRVVDGRRRCCSAVRHVQPEVPQERLDLRPRRQVRPATSGRCSRSRSTTRRSSPTSSASC